MQMNFILLYSAQKVRFGFIPEHPNFEINFAVK